MLKRVIAFGLSFMALFAILLFGNVDFSKIFSGSGVDELSKDEAKVYCAKVPESIRSLANKSSVTATLQLLKKEIGNVNLSRSESFKPTGEILGIAEFQVISYSLCTDFASNALTKEQYFKLKEDIIPLLRKRANSVAGFTADIGEVTFRRISPENVRAYVTVTLKSDSADNDVTASLIYGLLMLHNEATVGGSGRAEALDEECHQLPSCLAVTNEVASEGDPVLIRGGRASDDHRLSVDFQAPADLDAVRVYIQYYQRETRRGGVCTRDESRKSPETGIPHLKELSSAGEVYRSAECYYSNDQKTVDFSIKDKELT